MSLLYIIRREGVYFVTLSDSEGSRFFASLRMTVGLLNELIRRKS